MLVRLDRDSVAAGDDVEAHDREVSVDSRRPLLLFLREVLRDGYLPFIEGGHATWIVRTSRDGLPVAVLAQRSTSWEEPILIIEGDAEVATAGSTLYFDYRAQAEPAEVLEGLSGTP